MYKMHTKRNRKHHYSRRRHCRSRRAGGLVNLRNSLASARKSLASAIGKTQFLGPIKEVVNHKGMYDGMPSFFTGTMHKNGQYIQGNLFYNDTNGNMVGVHATRFNFLNHPCGTVKWINLDGTTMLNTDGKPSRKYIVTCGSGHVASYPFNQ
jgi:hypothetical protein